MDHPVRRARSPLMLETLRKAELLGETSNGRLPMTQMQRLSLNLALVTLGIDLDKLQDGLPHTTILEDENAVMLPPECGVSGAL